MQTSAIDYLVLTRPFNVALGAASVLLGALLAGPLEPTHKVVLACLAGACVLAAGNVINDYFDVAVDRINKPFRPLAAGKVSLPAALKFSIILFAFGLILSILINSASFLLAAGAAVVLVTYSWRLKDLVLLGNLAVSGLAALAFVFGGVAVGDWYQTVIPAAFAFLFHLGREIIKDIEDQEADRERAAATLPLKFGTRAALLVATMVFALLITATLLPYIFDVYGLAYLAVVVPGVDLVILGIVYYIWVNPLPESLRRISFVLKVDMIVGLIAVCLGIQAK